MERGESSRACGRACAWALAAATLLGASPLLAQSAARVELGGSMLPAGEHAAYARALSMLDTARNVSWAIQPFTPELERRLARLTSEDRDHPWRERFATARPVGSLRERIEAGWQRGEFSARLLRPDLLTIYNSALPVGMNDGVLWAGRGSTVAAQAGFHAQWRFIRMQFAPVVFRAQNADFTLFPNGQTGDSVYRDARRPTQIDLPQRFGDEAYGRFDFGDSFVEASLVGVSLGFSNSRISWGPARDHPLVHSVNPGGFPHVFIGTSHPLNIGIGRLHFRHLVGRMEQSDWSPIETGPLHRLHVGFIASFQPHFIPGLEVGGMRTMNTRWREGMPTTAQILRPFQDVINDQVGDINRNDENQFASLFIRFSPRGSGFEAYGEYSREDFSGNPRWLVMQPDDLPGVTLGIAHARRAADGTLHTIRGEMVNADLSHQERLGRGNQRPIPLYWHVRTRQGLTSRGQILGSAAAYGGAGGSVSWERYAPGERRGLAVERYINTDWFVPLGPIGGVAQPEVRYGLRAELSRTRGTGEWSVLAAPSWTLNRLLEPGRDQFNLNLQLRWRGW